MREQTKNKTFTLMLVKKNKWCHFKTATFCESFAQSVCFVRPHSAVWLQRQAALHGRDPVGCGAASVCFRSEWVRLVGSGLSVIVRVQPVRRRPQDVCF